MTRVWNSTGPVTAEEAPWKALYFIEENITMMQNITMESSTK
jgi:hypothetical protein